MNYEIRECEVSDIDGLIQMIQEHAQFEDAEFCPDGKANKLANALFNKPGTLYCWIIENNDVAVGYCTFTFDYSTWDAGTYMHMDCLYLRPDARGWGIGKAVMKRLKMLARERRCLNIQWQTPEFNSDAIAFYQRIGARKKNKVRFTLYL